MRTLNCKCLIVSIVVMSLAVLLGSGKEVLAQEANVIAIPACASASEAQASSESSPAIESALSAELPAGLSLRMLADMATDQWPPFASGLVMTVRYLTLDPGVRAAPRQTQGPLLFFIETGSVEFSINGRPQVFDQGSSVLIERGQNYQLRNDDPVGPATLLRLQIVPPGKETQVSRGDIADVRDGEQAFSPGPPFIRSRLLLTADLPVVEGRTHLILGCLTWADLAADTGDASHPGSIGLLVLDGQLLVGESGSVAAGQCIVYQPQVPHRLRAGTTPPVILMAGAVADGLPFWGDPSPDVGAQPGGRMSFNCDEQVEPDAIPDAEVVLPTTTQAGAWM